jgi:hypothetical protein
VSQRREQLKRRIEQRPSRQKLVTQHILLSAANVDPLVQLRGQLLKRNKLADNLNRKLQKRPGPLELVTKKILQVDEELEQAISEGRLPFKPTNKLRPAQSEHIIQAGSTVATEQFLSHQENSSEGGPFKMHNCLFRLVSCLPPSSAHKNGRHRERHRHGEGIPLHNELFFV